MEYLKERKTNCINGTQNETQKRRAKEQSLRGKFYGKYIMYLRY